MTRRWVVAMMLAGSVAMPATALAHEVTYEGTVAAVVLNRFAASDGVLARLEVKVSERRRTMILDITLHTRVWRGNRTVSFAEARMQKGEPVAVTTSDEELHEGALEIRLTNRE